MKTLLILMIMAGVAQADGGQTFVTGFANALNRSQGGIPSDSQPQPLNVTAEVVQVPYHAQLGIAAIRTDGSQGAIFPNYTACKHFVATTFGFTECAVVTY